MKKFFCHPSTITLIAVILIILILALFGFRITYNPSLDNNWDAISACAAWAAVVVSGLAIYFAIQVPKKIADEQNKITLYEKRYALLIELEHCFTYAYLLENLNEDGTNGSFLFGMAFTDAVDDKKDLLKIDMHALFYKSFNTLKQAEFLFDEETSNEIINLSRKLSLLIEAEKREKNILEAQNLYITQVKIVEEKYKSKIYAQLKLDQ